MSFQPIEVLNEIDVRRWLDEVVEVVKMNEKRKEEDKFSFLFLLEMCVLSVWPKSSNE